MLFAMSYGYLPLEKPYRGPGKLPPRWSQQVKNLARPYYLDTWVRVAVLKKGQATEARSRAHRAPPHTYPWWPNGIWELAVKDRGKELWVCYRGPADKPIFLRTNKVGRPIKEENLEHRAIRIRLSAEDSE